MRDVYDQIRAWDNVKRWTCGSVFFLIITDTMVGAEEMVVTQGEEMKKEEV